MKIKKMLKILLFVITIFVVIYSFYAIPIMYKLYKINGWQNKIGETLPDIFRIELPIIKNFDGYFCVRCTINNKYNEDYIIDTQASSLAKMESITRLNANYLDNYPIPVRNFYGQKERLPLYFFDSFKIQSLSLNNPLFKGVSKTNAMHGSMSNVVIGNAILKQLYWKFSLDDDKMIMFSNKDSLLFYKETKNYIKIEDGLIGSNNTLYFLDIQVQDNFMFDLGYSGDIMINKEIFTYLSKKASPKKFLSTRHVSGKNDTTYVFDKINIEWGSVKIPNCQVIFSPIVNRNIIGVKMMNRFNFVLAYNENDYDKEKNDLYIQPRNNYQNFKTIPYCSDFGFFIGKSDNEFIIKGFEVKGLADKAGIKLKDKIVSIDGGNFDLNNFNQLDSYLSDKKSVNIEIEKDGKLLIKSLSKNLLVNN